MTHRCHKQDILLKFARDRDGYQAKLREHLSRFEVALLQERIAQEQVKREPCWTESLAVGSVGFLERIKPLILSRRETEVVQTIGEIWVLQEPATHYGQKTGSKSGAKPLN